MQDKADDTCIKKNVMGRQFRESYINVTGSKPASLTSFCRRIVLAIIIYTRARKIPFNMALLGK